jgi:hypothetical protein
MQRYEHGHMKRGKSMNNHFKSSDYSHCYYITMNKHQ